MVSALATVRNRSGLHMRPAQVFVRSVSKFPCEVTLRVGEREALEAALEAITSGLGEWPEQ